MICAADVICRCATRPPTRCRWPAKNFNQLYNNCSGKHAGFLAYCMQHGQPIDSYLDPAHPLQQAVRASVAHFAGVNDSDLIMGIDGCSAPPTMRCRCRAWHCPMRDWRRANRMRSTVGHWTISIAP
ncbi:asparaginase [Undibacterium arcticum]